MPSFKPVNSLDQATCGWDKVDDFSSKNQLVHFEGKNYTIIAKEQRNVSSSKKMLYKVLNVLSFGILTACSKNVKNICLKGKETVRFAILIPDTNSSSTNSTSTLAPALLKTQATPQNQIDAEEKISTTFNNNKDEILKSQKQLAKVDKDINAEKEKITQILNKMEIATQRIENGYSFKEVNDLSNQRLEIVSGSFSPEMSRQVAYKALERKDVLVVSNGPTEIDACDEEIKEKVKERNSIINNINGTKYSVKLEIDAACAGLPVGFRNSQHVKYSKPMDAL